MQPGQGAFANPAEDAEAAAMRTAGLRGHWTLPATWRPRTRPPRLGNRCAISTSAALSSCDDFKNGQKTPCLRTARTYAILTSPAAGSFFKRATVRQPEIK